MDSMFVWCLSLLLSQEADLLISYLTKTNHIKKREIYENTKITNRHLLF